MTEEPDSGYAQPVEGFLNLLFALDSAALTLFAVVRQGGHLPAKLPIKLGPVLSLRDQVIALACCLAVIMVIRSPEMFPGQSNAALGANR